MTLGRDVRTQQGRMLLPKGTRLGGKHFRVLRIWGITEAEVEEVDVKASNDLPPIPAHILDAAKKLTLHKFRTCDLTQPFTRELASQYARRSARNAADGLCALTPPRSAPAAPHTTQHLDDPPSMAALARADSHLASLPDIFARIMEAVNNPRGSAATMAEVISGDPNLSAKLLRLVNSPHFGLARNVDSLSRAVAMAGSRRLISLAASLSVLTMFKKIPKQYMDMEGFWRHSIACGVAARLLGERTGENGDRLFACGLLHDIGRVVMLRSAPSLYLHTLNLARQSKKALHRTEKELWGYDHGRLTGAMLEGWRLPGPIVKAVRHHHSAAATIWENKETACIHVADGLARCLDPLDSASPMPVLQQAAWDVLELPRSSIATLMEQTGKQTADLITLLNAATTSCAQRKAS